MRRSLFGGVTVLMLCLAGCSGGEGERMLETPPELLEAIDAFYEAIEVGDVEARIGLFADDVIMMPNHWTRTDGKEAVAEMVRASSGAVFHIRGREALRLEVSGSLANTVNSYWYTYHAEGSEPQWHRTKNVHIWREVAPGDWKIAVDIWNSDVPIAAFAEE